jgi:di/tricarboxylate transporter
MTLGQALAFGIIGVTIGLFIWGRLPYDLVALASLLAGVATGIIPLDKAFDGFSDDVVVIVAAALLVSAAVSRSGAVETIMRPLLPFLRSTRSQVPVLVASVMIASVFTKNIGALAIFMGSSLSGVGSPRRTGCARLFDRAAD